MSNGNRVVVSALVIMPIYHLKHMAGSSNHGVQLVNSWLMALAAIFDCGGSCEDPLGPIGLTGRPAHA